MKKIVAVCCTYNRPRQLGVAINCFERQTYPNRALVVLDDAGQYDAQEGKLWRLVSTTDRYPSLGMKRNAATDLALEDGAEYLAVMDDDDYYLPHWLEAIAHALDEAMWCMPSLVYCDQDDHLQQRKTWGFYHAAWVFRREVFEKCGRYSVNMSIGEDQDLKQRLLKICSPVDSTSGKFAKPYFIWSPFYEGTEHFHLSEANARFRRGGYRPYAEQFVPPSAEKIALKVGFLRDLESLPIRQ